MRVSRGLAVSLLVLALLPQASAARAAEPPATPFHVVFLLADDLGAHDLACDGSDLHETPHLDRLAREGVRFRNAYAAAPICSPTRAAILTGKHPARLGMTIWHEGAVAGPPPGRRLLAADSISDLPHEERTLAEIFHDAGHFTAHVGKWHLGRATHYPETQGYDLNVAGTFWGAPSTFFHPFAGAWNPPVDPEFRYVPGLAPSNPGDYLTDRLTDRALEALEVARERLVFLSLWFHTVHTPIEGKPALVAHYEKKLETLKSERQRHRNPTYAAMVHSLDESVGRVLARIDALGIAERTVVVFTSDNGGVDFETRHGTPTTNAPLRSGKGTLHEGGLRVPLIVRWPGVTPRGKECDEIVRSEDFLPTLVEGLQLDAHTHGLGELDGVSLLPLLRDPSARLAPRPHFFHYPHYYTRMTPASAVRERSDSGDWKLVHTFEDDRVELYDLAKDPGETRDRAAEQPERARALRAALDDWRRAIGARLPRSPEETPP